MTNKHCDYVSIDIAYDLMDKLKVNKTQFSDLCGVTLGQFRHWELKGRMPEYRLSQLKLTLFRTFKAEFDSKVKILEDNE